MKKQYNLAIIEGVEGPCVSVNDFRLVGPKPWGGGRIVREWSFDLADLQRAFPGLEIKEKPKQKAIT